MRRTFNSACHQLREKRDKKRIRNRITLGRNVAAINIDGIAQSLKGIKRNAYGQQPRELGQTKMDSLMAEKCRHIVGHKLIILKQKQDGEVEHNTQRKPKSPPNGVQLRLRHEQCSKIGDERTGEQQQGIHGLPIHVKIITGQQQKEIAAPHTTPAERQGANHRKEQKEMNGIKQHNSCLKDSRDVL